MARTASRPILGSIAELSLELAQAPCGPIGMKSPDDLTREILANASVQ